jgi:glycolate dehydrogenase FAD-binding subunit
MMHRFDSEAAVADFVRRCGERGQPVHAIGSGTKLLHGPTAPADAETVSLRGLDRITSHEPGDLVVTVQCGARLTDLQEKLAAHGQWLPLDPPYAEATIGGILATNSSGPRRFGYGTMRDHLIGLRVVDGRGVVTRSGGRVVKNVTGYDLHKLHIGAFGTLGIMTEANFKVRPLPPVSKAIVFTTESFEAAHVLLLEIYGLPLGPVALEAVGESAIVGVEGSEAVVERHVRDLRRLGRPFEVREAGPVWSALRELPPDAVRIRIGARPHDLPPLVPPGLRRRAHAGNGIARVDLEPSPDLPARIAEWRTRAEARGGYVVVESAPAGCPERDRLPWGGPQHRLAGAIRELWDPDGVVNRGRMAV